MEIVEINCPRGINLKNVIKNNKEDTKYLLQTVDIFDKVTVTKNINEKNGIFIECNKDLNDELKNDIRKIINIYSKYTNIKINNLVIKIEKNEIDLLENKYNILAAILLGLNIYFNSKKIFCL